MVGSHTSYSVPVYAAAAAAAVMGGKGRCEVFQGVAGISSQGRQRPSPFELIFEGQADDNQISHAPHPAPQAAGWRPTNTHPLLSCTPCSAPHPAPLKRTPFGILHPMWGAKTPAPLHPTHHPATWGAKEAPRPCPHYHIHTRT